MSQDARDRARRIVVEVLEAHGLGPDGAPRDASADTGEGSDAPGAVTQRPAGAVPDGAVAAGTVPDEATAARAGSADQTPVAAETGGAGRRGHAADPEARRVAHRIVEEVLADHAERTRGSWSATDPDGPPPLPEEVRGSPTGPGRVTGSQRPVPSDELDEDSDPVRIARRLVAEVLAARVDEPTDAAETDDRGDPRPPPEPVPEPDPSGGADPDPAGAADPGRAGGVDPDPAGAADRVAAAEPAGGPAMAEPPAEPPTAADDAEDLPTERRTGRWLVATILVAIALALLFPLAVAAVRELVPLTP